MGMYSLATGLSTFNNRSAIKVRVIRSYVVREKKGSAQIKSQELVLHDPESNQPLKQITELAGKTLLFQITAKSDHTSYRNTPFPVLRINNDPLIIKEYCSQLLNLEENACNSNMQISLGDDDFLEGFLSDEAESPIASIPHVAVGDSSIPHVAVGFSNLRVVLWDQNIYYKRRITLKFETQ
nr:putative transposase [Ipomoea batatas]